MGRGAQLVLPAQTWAPKLLELYDANPEFVRPRARYNEARSLIAGGLEDVSFSRATVTWGVPLPWEPEQTIYVWVDALLNYRTALEYGLGRDVTETFWPTSLHVMAKDILRLHGVGRCDDAEHLEVAARYPAGWHVRWRLRRIDGTGRKGSSDTGCHPGQDALVALNRLEHWIEQHEPLAVPARLEDDEPLRIGTGSACMTTVWSTTKTEVAAPMPTASEATASDANTGLRRRIRMAYAESCRA